MAVGPYLALLAAFAAGPMQAPPSAPAPAVLSSSDEQTLKTANIAAAGPGLLDFFHKRSGTPTEKTQLAGLIKQLSDGPTRDAASAQLISIGEAAVPILREAANNLDDPDFAGRARTCLQNIEGAQGATL